MHNNRANRNDDNMTAHTHTQRFTNCMCRRDDGDEMMGEMAVIIIIIIESISGAFNIDSCYFSTIAKRNRQITYFQHYII